jgi:hypothetical protein
MYDYATNQDLAGESQLLSRTSYLLKPEMLVLG